MAELFKERLLKLAAEVKRNILGLQERLPLRVGVDPDLERDGLVTNQAKLPSPEPVGVTGVHSLALNHLGLLIGEVPLDIRPNGSVGFVLQNEKISDWVTQLAKAHGRRLRVTHRAALYRYGAPLHTESAVRERERSVF